MKTLLFCFVVVVTFDFIYVNGYTRMNFSVNEASATEHVLQCSNADTEVIIGTAARQGADADTARRTQPPTAKKHAWAHHDRIKEELHKQLYGDKIEVPQHQRIATEISKVSPMKNLQHDGEAEYDGDNLTIYHYPDGQVLRAELFNHKSAVHFPPRDFIYKGYALLNVTNDHMQTAINAFAILLEGTVADVQNLPSDYVLRSARTIAMMKITREKLAMLWTVLKGGRSTAEVTYEELEMYRPLFKYVNAREIGRLNLKDNRILNFVGTHADLDRHQVGVVASKYIAMNANWSQVSYLNHMNNLLCGVPMNFMRRIPSEVYLQLSQQVFYHIRACDPLQRRFYLAMMTKTEALGKSYSWSARDVSRLGLLLAEVPGLDLAAINPEAMSGITAQVMMEIPAQNLEYLTEIQVEYLALKPLTVFARKIKALSESYETDRATRIVHWCTQFVILVLILIT